MVVQGERLEVRELHSQSKFFCGRPALRAISSVKRTLDNCIVVPGLSIAQLIISSIYKAAIDGYRV
ncbi:hypothetical protein EJ110_NYTH00205 [Nymphaea thermarum]|nr:hypothetical protein EJ110_NYTH00205 [Nymphaea thermarum]